MQKHPIDDLFGRKLEKAAVKPTAGAWARIQERQGKQKRPVAYWWYASAAACLFLVGFASWLLWRTDNMVSKPTGLAVQQRTSTPQAHKELIKPKELPQAPAHTPIEVEEELAKVERSGKHNRIVEPARHTTESIVAVKSEPLRPLTNENTGTEQKQPEGIANANPIIEKKTADAPTVAPEKTLIVQLAPPQEVVAQVSPEEDLQSDQAETIPKRKRTKMGRILRQLNHLREGEPIDWQEVGVQPGTLLAKASRTVEEGREKITDSYENIRSNAFRKNAEK